jgi:BirA family biotin operon repressor/biotin-[acetyl-CoA-carboxylase] ligase
MTTLFLGKNIHSFSSCESTNLEAAKKIQQGNCLEGDLFVTQNQTAGRGQRDNVWESQAKSNLTFSIVLRPNFLLISEQFYLNMAISLAIIESLRGELKDKLKVKWSNDIYYEDKKLGGVLIENNIQGAKIAYSIIGIGLNINQLVFQNPKAISLSAITGKTYDLDKKIAQIVENIERNYIFLKQGKKDLIKTNYLAQLYWYQELHKFKNLQTQTEFEGQIIGIDKVGRLAMEVNRKVLYFNFKEIQFQN